MAGKKVSRTIIHFDYDCFYASVFENENPALRSLPLAVQQKQIIVTCNYEARRRGLRKLQLISEAKKIVPDVVIVLGEDLGRFRNASKMLYKFLEEFTWSGKVEKLGFDEVFMDITDIVEYNIDLLNLNDLENSFFNTNRTDPTIGFAFDATGIAGHGFPDLHTSSPSATPLTPEKSDLSKRLILGSHFAQHLRLRLEEEKGYTSTVGISTNKLLSKLVGNLHKPKSQTTLLPPYYQNSGGDSSLYVDTAKESNITKFLDEHEIGKIPGIGFKSAQRIRDHVLSASIGAHNRPSNWEIQNPLTVRDARLFEGMGSDLLESILGGPGSERGIGEKIWGLLNGFDDTEVKEARRIPSQISIEDSYVRLETMAQVQKELRILASSLIKRMHIDLVEDDEDDKKSGITQRWMAHPKTLRLSTRPRPSHADATRTRTFNRISRSCPMPNFIFNLKEGIDAIVERLVEESLIPMFRRLHPQGGWNLSLINIGVTNMVETASDKGGGGRDIGKMFKGQEAILREWKVEDRDIPPGTILKDSEAKSDIIQAEPSAGSEALGGIITGSEDVIYPTQNTVDEPGQWEEDEDEAEDEDYEKCCACGAVMPGFAMAAHERFHSLDE
ncbi:hypothetical protein B7494_g8223 [Chlorociboria aeruginascens]|nr:hypothetical protein B7494_g8223 [Chlorociboria aeruginascens]